MINWLASERSRRIDGHLRRRWLSQTGAKRTARLKAVPSAAWLGVRAAVFLDPRQCHAQNGVPAIG
jgi:hypothetical protein